MNPRLPTLPALALLAAVGSSLSRAEEAPALPEAADQFLDCLAISEEQRETDPDPAMKAHWGQFSDIYAANIWASTHSVQTIFDHIQGKMQKWANMRQFIAAQSVNALALNLLKKCDEKALANPVRMEDFRTAMTDYQKQRAAAPAP